MISYKRINGGELYPVEKLKEVPKEVIITLKEDTTEEKPKTKKRRTKKDV